jgi:hypothetical protein
VPNNRLPRTALCHVWAYRARHVRTASELNQLLRVLDHCLDHDSLRDAAYGATLAEHRRAEGGAGGGTCYDYRAIGAALDEEWVHEDELELPLIKAYRRAVLLPAKQRELKDRQRREAVSG